MYFARPNSISTSKQGCETFRAAIGDVSALKAGALWVFALANVLETLSYFLPPLYLPGKSSPTQTQGQANNTDTDNAMFE